ncbi:hypothetical protein FOTG_19202 [Fusarium oxysporum f. sp. vasinfectum 25433]|uniref:Uncharacterized protein n=1 Tax=Fusarium oxysporum f. sp. vasinfectum 25433 TaxID=1089449 RepID=X0KU59_FUSOX|nr:hypothetical protein FOTG_19202 [Fusarium oxysporum f. sp. vasinfectum 25433]
MPTTVSSQEAPFPHCHRRASLPCQRHSLAKPFARKFPFLKGLFLRGGPRTSKTR